MTDDLRDLLASAGRDEASAARREDFHGAFGDAVRGRVKRRRAVRAAGVGSVAAVSVGAIAFGAVRLPGMTDAGPAVAPEAGMCSGGSIALAPSDVYGEYYPVPDAAPRAHGIDITTLRTKETWAIYDQVAEHVAGELSVAPDGMLSVVDMEGRTYDVAPNDYGRFVFEAPSGGWVSFEAGNGGDFDWTAEPPNFASTTTSPTAPGTGVLCVPAEHQAPAPEVSASDEATTSPSPAPSPNPSADPAAASSPYQCGFEFPEESRLPEEWAIEDAAWLEPSDVWARIEQQFEEPIEGIFVEPTDSVLTISAGGTLGAFEGLGGYASEAGTTDPVGTSFSGPYVVTSTSVVAVVDGVVVATLEGGAVAGLAQQYLDPRQQAQDLYVLDLGAIEPCDGQAREDADLYAVSGALLRAADDTSGEVIYGWQEIDRP